MPSKTAHMGLQRVTSQVRYSRTQINPAPGNTQARLHCFKEEEEIVHVQIY